MIFDARFGEFIFELRVKHLLEQVFEPSVINLEDRVLGGQIDGPAKVQAIVERGACKVDDRGVEVVHAHRDTRAGAVIDLFLDHGAIFAHEFHRQLTGAGHQEICRLVLVAKGMPPDHNRIGPTGHKAGHVFTDDRRAEHNAAQNVADRAVGRTPHLFEAEFLNPVFIGGDCGTFHANADFLDLLGRINRDLVVGLVADLHREIVIEQVDIQIGQDQLFFDEVPDDAGHFITVELDDGVFYLDLRHG